MLLDVYRGGVGYFYHLVVIFSSMIRMLIGVMSFPIFSHCEQRTVDLHELRLATHPQFDEQPVLL